MYLYSFVLVVKPWSTLDATYFMQTQTIALTVFGITAGGLMYYVRYYKPWLIFGLIIRLMYVFIYPLCICLISFNVCFLF